MIEGFSLALPAAQSTSAEVDLAALVETYSALLFRVVHSILRNTSESEDVVQDVFVRVMEHRKELPAVRDMRVWLIRIAWNLAIDRRKKIRPEQMDEFLTAALIGKDVPADIALTEMQQMKAVFREIERLPKAERQAILLSALEDLGSVELAKVMGKSESAARALLFRARKRLRERLGERGYA